MAALLHLSPAHRYLAMHGRNGTRPPPAGKDPPGGGRHRRPWWLAAAAVILLAFGMASGSGLLLAAGLIAATFAIAPPGTRP